MPTHLTSKQRTFADNYLETGNATEAAMIAYDTSERRIAASIGSENLTKPDIRAYLEDKAIAASSMIFRLSQQARSETVRLAASKDILDRIGFAVNRKITDSNEKQIIMKIMKFGDEDPLTSTLEAQ